MKLRPIIFNTEMVRAILDGRKTQTRRPMKQQPEYRTNRGYVWHIHRKKTVEQLTHNGLFSKCPFGKTGDTLWVRETFRAWCVDGTDTIEDGYRHVRYKADGVERKTETIWDLDCNEGPFEAGLNEEPSKWIPSIHMPRWASRITLRITGVRVEKLQDISEKDAIAEGIEWDETHNGFRGQIRHRGMSTWHSRASEAFGFFWDTLNSKEGYRWKDNPWVWVVSFERIEK